MHEMHTSVLNIRHGSLVENDAQIKPRLYVNRQDNNNNKIIIIIILRTMFTVMSS